jgi:hypothetical protein
LTAGGNPAWVSASHTHSLLADTVSSLAGCLQEPRARSAILNRRQKVSEDEWITGCHVTMKGNSSEILYLLTKHLRDQGPRSVQTLRQYYMQRIGEPHEETRSRRSTGVTHPFSQATSEIPTFFCFELSRLAYVPST